MTQAATAPADTARRAGDADWSLRALTAMWTIRRFEEAVDDLFARGMMRDGPFPVHYEPFESPIANPIAPRVRGNPVARVFRNDMEQFGDADEFPYAATSYRLTEHFHFWTKHVQPNAVMQPEFFVEIIEDELNVKKVTFTDDVSAYTSYTFKPQLRTVGPKYVKFLGQIQKALAALDGNAAMAELKANGVLALPSVDESVKLAEEDLLITMTQMEGYVTEGDNTVTVVLDTNLTPELIEEGFVREIISKIQTMRKEAGFEVMDQITIYHKSDEKVSGIFEQYGDTIKSDVLGVNVVADAAGAFADEPEV